MESSVAVSLAVVVVVGKTKFRLGIVGTHVVGLETEKLGLASLDRHSVVVGESDRELN